VPSGIRPQKTSVLIAQRIVEEIQRLGKSAGDRLPPEKVMLDEYGVGRGTLRESLRFLELQGVISIKPGPQGGPVVEQPSSSGLATSLTLLLQFERAPYRTIIEAREALEPAIASLAAERLSDADLARLKANIDAMAENVDDERTFLMLNREFHDIVATGSGNELFHHLIEALIGILDGSSVGIDYPTRRRLAINAAHEKIYETLASRDPEAAAIAMRLHINEYSKYVQRRFPTLADGPIVWVTP
jgi:GntR family transcriptional repressor for pyruvate dehydrogenase complex